MNQYLDLFVGECAPGLGGESRHHGPGCAPRNNLSDHIVVCDGKILGIIQRKTAISTTVLAMATCAILTVNYREVPDRGRFQFDVGGGRSTGQPSASGKSKKCDQAQEPAQYVLAPHP